MSIVLAERLAKVTGSATMKVAAEADRLKRAGHQIVDFGTHDGSLQDDYPDYAKQVGEAIQQGVAEIAMKVGVAGIEFDRLTDQVDGDSVIPDLMSNCP